MNKIIKKILNIIKRLRALGLAGILKYINRRLPKRRIKHYKRYQKLFYNKCGIEIGGPTPLFKRDLPIYKKIKSLDGVNFSSSTVWEGELVEGQNFKYGENKTGYQFICDAVDLYKIESGRYDFVLSSNTLEHIANPFKALTEWLRIIKPGGLLLLVLPNKDSNFDHNRKITDFEHLVEDFKNNTSEEDLTHLDEILALHDLSMDPPSGDIDNFRKRSLNNFQNRCLHHHVFDLNLLKQIFEYFNIELLLNDCTKRDFFIVGIKK
jgi:SAM-dependent methyltransferase